MDRQIHPIDGYCDLDDLLGQCLEFADRNGLAMTAIGISTAIDHFAIERLKLRSTGKVSEHAVPQLSGLIDEKIMETAAA